MNYQSCELNSALVERVAMELTTVVTTFGSPLPYLGGTHTKPNNSVSRPSEVRPSNALRIVALSSLSRFTITSRLLAHSSHPRIASIHPSSTLAATRSKALSQQSSCRAHRAPHPHGRRSGSPKTRRPMPQTLATSKSLPFHVAHVVRRPSLVRPRSGPHLC